MITIRPDQLGAYMKTWTKAKQAAVVKGCRIAAARCEGLVKERTTYGIRPHAPVNTGRYKSSWKHASRSNGDVVAALWNEAPYSGKIEHGSRPGDTPYPTRSPQGHLVPMFEILRWTFLKFKGRLGFKKINDAWGLALKIQMKLYAKGTAARNVLGDKSFRIRMADVTAQEIRLALSKSIGRGP